MRYLRVLVLAYSAMSSQVGAGHVMRVLLIDPPFQRFLGFHRYYYPMGLTYLAAVATAAGHEAIVYDGEHARGAGHAAVGGGRARFDVWQEALRDPTHPLWLEAEEIIRREHPMSWASRCCRSRPRARDASLRSPSASHPDVPVVVGGDHPTVWPEKMLANPDIDVVVRGEGEATFVELLEALEAPGLARDGRPCGLHIRRPGRQRSSGHRSPAHRRSGHGARSRAGRAASELETYRPVDLGAVIGMRGCPYDCSFCGVATVWTHRVRKRSPQTWWTSSRRSMPGSRRHTSRSGTRRSRWTGEWAIEVAREIMARGLERPWEAVTRADKLDRELLEIMRASGCRRCGSEWNREARRS